MIKTAILLGDNWYLFDDIPDNLPSIENIKKLPRVYDDNIVDSCDYLVEILDDGTKLVFNNKGDENDSK